LPDSGCSFGWILNLTEIPQETQHYLSVHSLTTGSLIGLVDVPEGVGSELGRRPSKGDVFSVENGEFEHFRLEGTFCDVLLIFQCSLMIVADSHSHEIF